MARKICITEEQYKRIMKEVEEKTPSVIVPSEGLSNANQAISDAKDKVNKGEVEYKTLPDKYGNQIVHKPNANGNGGTDTNSIAEGQLISKSKLMEHRLKALKKNSHVYSVRDFMKSIKS